MTNALRNQRYDFGLHSPRVREDSKLLFGWQKIKSYGCQGPNSSKIKVGIINKNDH